MLGLGELYLPAFALVLGARPFEVGLLTTVPMLVGSFFQLVAPGLARRTGNRAWVVGSAVLQALTFLPILGLGVSGGGYGWLLAWVCVYWALALGIGPAWNDWMGRMVPEAVRGRYFGRRNGWLQASLLAALLLAGLIVQAATGTRFGATAGFVLIFALALLLRLASAGFLALQHEPAVKSVDQPTAVRPRRKLRPGHPAFRVVGVLVLVTGAVNISAAYFTPYMLEELKLSYIEFTILNVVMVLARIVSARRWSEIAHRFGNRRVLQVAGTLVVPLAAMWVVSDNFFWLIALQTVAGFAWAGFDLALILNLLDCTDDDDRATVLSTYTLLNGLGIVLGSLLGGAILEALGNSGYHVIFILSSSIRLLTMLLLGRGTGRKRPGEHSFSDVFVRVVSPRPGKRAAH